jgi:hypothetical protein
MVEKLKLQEDRQLSKLPALGRAPEDGSRAKKLIVLRNKLAEALERENRCKANLPDAAAQCNVSGAPWQCLNFLPESHGHGSLRPGAGIKRPTLDKPLIVGR